MARAKNKVRKNHSRQNTQRAERKAGKNQAKPNQARRSRAGTSQAELSRAEQRPAEQSRPTDHPSEPQTIYANSWPTIRMTATSKGWTKNSVPIRSVPCGCVCACANYPPRNFLFFIGIIFLRCTMVFKNHEVEIRVMFSPSV